MECHVQVLITAHVSFQKGNLTEGAPPYAPNATPWRLAPLRFLGATGTKLLR